MRRLHYSIHTENAYCAAILPMILIMEKPVTASNSFLYTFFQEVKTPPNTYIKVDDLFEWLNQPAKPLCKCIKWQQGYFQIEQFELAKPTMNQSVWTLRTSTP